jgi:hypothetical protein
MKEATSHLCGEGGGRAGAVWNRAACCLSDALCVGVAEECGCARSYIRKHCLAKAHTVNQLRCKSPGMSRSITLPLGREALLQPTCSELPRC